MQKDSRLRVPISTFAKFCAAKDEKSRLNLVRGAKSQTGKNGGDYYARFKRIVKTACQMGQDIDTVEDDLTTQVVNVEPEKTRLPLLRDAFLDQWRKHGYQFFAVHGKDVKVARLTLRVSVDLGVLTRAGDEIAVRLWLSEADLLDRERDTFICLLSEAKRTAQWPQVWSYGVWELEGGRIEHAMTVTDKLRNLTHEKADIFAEMWDALPSSVSFLSAKLP